MSEQTKHKLFNMQPIVMKTLQNSLRKNSVSHAYLLTGDDESQMEHIVKWFLKSLYCEQEQFGCDNCVTCRQVEQFQYPSIYVIDEEKEIKKDVILELQSEFSKTSFDDGYKVFIVKNADKMNDSAQNKLLKFLEEPDGKQIGILMTKNSEKLLSTILSRCQILKLRYAPSEDVVNDMAVEYEITSDLADYVLTVFKDKQTAQKLVSEKEIKKTFEFVDKLFVKVLLNQNDKYLYVGKEFKSMPNTEQIVPMMIYILRKVLIAKIAKDNLVSNLECARLLESKSIEHILKMIDVCMEAEKRMSYRVNVQLQLESLVLSL